jgi:hypothetical protein
MAQKASSILASSALSASLVAGFAEIPSGETGLIGGSPASPVQKQQSSRVVKESLINEIAGNSPRVLAS